MRYETKRRGFARERVLDRLQQGAATNRDLNELCFRYGARILELRRMGHQIKTHKRRAGDVLYEYQGFTSPAQKAA